MKDRYVQAMAALHRLCVVVGAFMLVRSS